MSSFFGHTVIGYSISKFGINSKLWMLWLIFAAIAPDIDYIFLWFLRVQLPIRYTHSIGFCLAFCILTILFLKLAKVKKIKEHSFQIILASFSHLFLDLLVGVYKNPWLWPISSETFRLPFGFLPSAGAISLSNKYLYKNLLIEMGIILPILFLINLTKQNKKITLKIIILWLLIWIPFLTLGYNLKR